jgi:hypothetical protein
VLLYFPIAIRSLLPCSQRFRFGTWIVVDFKRHLKDILVWFRELLYPQMALGSALLAPVHLWHAPIGVQVETFNMGGRIPEGLSFSVDQKYIFTSLGAIAIPKEYQSVRYPENGDEPTILGISSKMGGSIQGIEYAGFRRLGVQNYTKKPVMSLPGTVIMW